MQNLKIGDVVVMNDKYCITENNKGKEFEVCSEPWDLCGTMVVKLKGYSGSYAVDGLDLIRSVDNLCMNFYKVKFIKSGQPAGRAYTYKSRLNLAPDDKVELPGSKHAVVVDELVDMDWVQAYGEENLKEIVKKMEVEE